MACQQIFEHEILIWRDSVTCQQFCLNETKEKYRLNETNPIKIGYKI